MANCPGFELFYSGVQSKIKSQHDCIIAFIHWKFVQNGFKCIGLCEDGPKKKSEVLPAGWNESDENYILRYEPSGSEELYHLKVLRIEGSLLVHILRGCDNRVVDLSIRTADFIDSDHLSDFERCFRNLDELNKLVVDQLFKGLKDVSPGIPTSSSTRSESTRSTAREGQRAGVEDPLRMPMRRPPYRVEEDWSGRVDPFSVGTGDLDPFSGASPGMLMDPMRGGFSGPRLDPTGGFGMPGRLPRGAIPPGARFDPIGPPRPDSGRNPTHPFSGEPNPDHMRPPDYDDMFM